MITQSLAILRLAPEGAPVAALTYSGHRTGVRNHAVPTGQWSGARTVTISLKCFTGTRD